MAKRGKAQAAKAVEARGGISRSDLMDDKSRGPVSSLGQGTKEDKEKLRASLMLRGRKGAR